MAKKETELNICANIARLRKRQGLTQSQLAEMLCISNETVSKWERGGGYPEITQLFNLSRILGTTVDMLMMSERYGITTPMSKSQRLSRNNLRKTRISREKTANLAN